MDNCSADRGQKAVDRLRSQWPNVLLVHTPVHASWLNQIEIYFSIVQRNIPRGQIGPGAFTEVFVFDSGGTTGCGSQCRLLAAARLNTAFFVG